MSEDAEINETGEACGLCFFFQRKAVWSWSFLLSFC